MSNVLLFAGVFQVFEVSYFQQAGYVYTVNRNDVICVCGVCAPVRAYARGCVRACECACTFWSAPRKKVWRVGIFSKMAGLSHVACTRASR